MERRVLRISLLVKRRRKLRDRMSKDTKVHSGGTWVMRGNGNCLVMTFLF